MEFKNGDHPNSAAQDTVNFTFLSFNKIKVRDFSTIILLHLKLFSIFSLLVKITQKVYIIWGMLFFIKSKYRYYELFSYKFISDFQ